MQHTAQPAASDRPCVHLALQALELVIAEMRRADLTPSMRCRLLGVSGALCKRPEVAAFWEQCAGLKDKEVSMTD